MKRSILLLLVIAFISIQSYSQENKGKFTLGGRAMLVPNLKTLKDIVIQKTVQFYWIYLLAILFPTGF